VVFFFTFSCFCQRTFIYINNSLLNLTAILQFKRTTFFGLFLCNLLRFFVEEADEWFVGFLVIVIRSSVLSWSHVRPLRRLVLLVVLSSFTSALGVRNLSLFLCRNILAKDRMFSPTFIESAERVNASSLTISGERQR